jgi:hypothetical protein
MDDLPIPAFLDRRKYDEKGNLIKSPTPDWVQTSGAVNAPRQWAKIKSVSEVRRRERRPIFCDDPSYEVQVNISQGGRVISVAIYDDFQEFQDEHDFEAHPIKKMATVGNQTIVLVGGYINIPADPKIPSTLMSRAPRQANTRDLIWKRADELWAAAGSPKDIKVVLKLRKEWMNLLQKEGVNRSTCSCEFGNWQKARIS